MPGGVVVVTASLGSRQRVNGERTIEIVARLSRNRSGCGPVAVTGVIALTVSAVVRACSGPGGGEVVAVQLGEVVGRHQ
jgi:hypothetical protein